MPKYLYTSQRTAIALPPKKEGDEPVDVPLIPNKEVELPADMAYVKRLIRKGQLKLIEAPKSSRSRSKPEAEK